jgi:hypothetical protein
MAAAVSRDNLFEGQLSAAEKAQMSFEELEKYLRKISLMAETQKAENALLQATNENKFLKASAEAPLAPARAPLASDAPLAPAPAVSLPAASAAGKKKKQRGRRASVVGPDESEEVSQLNIVTQGNLQSGLRACEQCVAKGTHHCDKRILPPGFYHPSVSDIEMVRHRESRFLTKRGYKAECKYCAQGNCNGVPYEYMSCIAHDSERTPLQQESDAAHE